MKHVLALASASASASATIWCWALLGFLGLAAGSAGAQTVASTPSGQSATNVYQDRVIENSALGSEEVADTPYNSEGLPRGYTLESNIERRGVLTQTQLLGLRASGYADTLYWGSFSGQIGYQQGSSLNTLNPTGLKQSSSQTSWVLRQLGMPLEGGWRLSNALGQISLPVPELSRQSLRLGLPSASMVGVATQWQQAQGLQVNAAAGKSGRFEGFPVPSFSTTGGQYAYLGVQDRIETPAASTFGTGRWQWSAALAAAQNVPSSLDFSPLGEGRVNAQSLYLAVQRQWPNTQGLSPQPDQMQLNLLASRNDGRDATGLRQPDAQGLWLDGAFNREGHAHQWGLFYLQPQLNWLDANVASDLQGAYWRHAWGSRQWASESSLELLAPVQGNTPAGFFATQSLRYQYSTRTSFGGSLNIRRYISQGQSLLLYSQWSSGWGRSRAQLELASLKPADRLVRMQLDHEWEAGADLRLSTSLSLDREKREGLISRGWGLALSMDWNLTPNLSFTPSLNSRSSEGQLQYTLNTGLSWRIAPQWSLNATVFAVKGNPQTGSLVQSPLVTPAAKVQSLQDKGIFISLRYTQAAGSTQVPVGGAPGSAAGQLQGVVFLDDNGNGQQEASERGAAQITVVLDGRFTTETNAQGRFEFPYVAAGAHVITVVSDNLPLPWLINNDGRQQVQVRTRDTTAVSIGAVKP
jgi:SdrD B-like domain